MLRSYDYKVSNKNLERKLFEQDVTLNAMVTSAKQLQKKFSLIENEKRQLVKTNDELMRKYGAQNIVVGKSVKRPAKGVPNCLVGMAVYISRALPKWCLRENSKLNYFSEDLCLH